MNLSERPLPLSSFLAALAANMDMNNLVWHYLHESWRLSEKQILSNSCIKRVSFTARLRDACCSTGDPGQFWTCLEFNEWSIYVKQIHSILRYLCNFVHFVQTQVAAEHSVLGSKVLDVAGEWLEAAWDKVWTEAKRWHVKNVLIICNS